MVSHRDPVHPACSFLRQEEVVSRAPGELRTPSRVGSFHLSVNGFGIEAAKQSPVRGCFVDKSTFEVWGVTRAVVLTTAWMLPDPFLCFFTSHFGLVARILLIPSPSPPPFAHLVGFLTTFLFLLIQHRVLALSPRSKIHTCLPGTAHTGSRHRGSPAFQLPTVPSRGKQDNFKSMSSL